MAKTFCYPEVESLHIRGMNESSIKLKTILRLERDNVVYNLDIYKEYPLNPMSDQLPFTEINDFHAYVYRLQKCYIITKDVNRISKSQISEADRMTLLQLIPLHGLENLI